MDRDVYFPEGKNLQLHPLYRALDFLVEEKETIETGLFNKLLDLFSLNKDVVFYDTSLVSYQGEGEGNSLVQYSRKKEKGFLVGLMLSRDGFPFAHQVLPGNTADVSTVEEVADRLSERFSIGRRLFVADRGMISRSNLDYLESQGREYAVGVPARKYKKVRQVVLSTEEDVGLTPAKAVRKLGRMKVVQMEVKDTPTYFGPKDRRRRTRSLKLCR